MMGLALPRHVVAEIQREQWAEQRRERQALLDRLIDFDDPVCREWTPVLAKIDPLLRLGRARPQAYEPGYTITPGFYHWVRDNPTAAATIEPITGPDGFSFAEPDSRLLDQLRANDLQHPDVWRALVERNAVLERERAAEEAQEDAERQEEIVERYKAATRTQVLMSPDVPWSQNSAGRKRRPA